MGTARTRHSKSPSAKSYYTLTDQALDKLSQEGDARAKAALTARHAVRRLATTPDTGTYRDYSCFLSNGLRVEFHKDFDGWVSMAVRVDEDTTRDGLTGAWKELDTWRTLLAEWQGPWCAGSHGQLLTQLYYRQRDGASYSTLAQELSDAAADHLRAHSKETDPWGLNRAQTLFRIMGVKPKEIADHCDSIITRLSAGFSPFISKKDWPISREAMISTLRTWRSQNKQWIDAHPPKDPAINRRLNRISPRLAPRT